MEDHSYWSIGKEKRRSTSPAVSPSRQSLSQRCMPIRTYLKIYSPKRTSCLSICRKGRQRSTTLWDLNGGNLGSPSGRGLWTRSFWSVVSKRELSKICKHLLQGGPGIWIAA